MDEETLTIGEIAKLFDLPTSKIRYWEEKEVFTPRRNSNNDYRTFNIQSSIELLDVIFYRNLNVPIQKMKHFNQLSPESIYSILNDTEKEVEEELANLKNKLVGIEQRKRQLEELFVLKKGGYQFEKIEIEKIVPVDMSSPEDIQIQLEYLSNFTLYKDLEADSEFQMGISVTPDYQHQQGVLWEKDLVERKYITCLLECDSEDFEKSNLTNHLDTLRDEGYKITRVIASYLATASDETNEPLDYYKGWLEIEN